MVSQNEDLCLVSFLQAPQDSADGVVLGSDGAPAAHQAHDGLDSGDAVVPKVCIKF